MTLFFSVEKLRIDEWKHTSELIRPPGPADLLFYCMQICNSDQRSRDSFAKLVGKCLNACGSPNLHHSWDNAAVWIGLTKHQEQLGVQFTLRSESTSLTQIQYELNVMTLMKGGCCRSTGSGCPSVSGCRRGFCSKTLYSQWKCKTWIVFCPDCCGSSSPSSSSSPSLHHSITSHDSQPPCFCDAARTSQRR